MFSCRSAQLCIFAAGTTAGATNKKGAEEESAGREKAAGRTGQARATENQAGGPVEASTAAGRLRSRGRNAPSRNSRGLSRKTGRAKCSSGSIRSSRPSRNRTVPVKMPKGGKTSSGRTPGSRKINRGSRNANEVRKNNSKGRGTRTYAIKLATYIHGTAAA